AGWPAGWPATATYVPSPPPWGSRRAPPDRAGAWFSARPAPRRSADLAAPRSLARATRPVPRAAAAPRIPRSPRRIRVTLARGGNGGGHGLGTAGIGRPLAPRGPASRGNLTGVPGPCRPESGARDAGRL